MIRDAQINETSLLKTVSKLETAIEAAKGSGIFSVIIPVDYTRVQYVNRMRKGKPGQVVYYREKLSLLIWTDCSELNS